jgi:hypothetical protein
LEYARVKCVGRRSRRLGRRFVKRLAVLTGPSKLRENDVISKWSLGYVII